MGACCCVEKPGEGKEFDFHPLEERGSLNSPGNSRPLSSPAPPSSRNPNIPTPQPSPRPSSPVANDSSSSTLSIPGSVGGSRPATPQPSPRHSSLSSAPASSSELPHVLVHCDKRPEWSWFPADYTVLDDGTLVLNGKQQSGRCCSVDALSAILEKDTISAEALSNPDQPNTLSLGGFQLSFDTQQNQLQFLNTLGQCLTKTIESGETTIRANVLTVTVNKDKSACSVKFTGVSNEDGQLGTIYEYSGDEGEKKYMFILNGDEDEKQCAVEGVSLRDWNRVAYVIDDEKFPGLQYRGSWYARGERSVADVPFPFPNHSWVYAVNLDEAAPRQLRFCSMKEEMNDEEFMTKKLAILQQLSRPFFLLSTRLTAEGLTQLVAYNFLAALHDQPRLFGSDDGEQKDFGAYVDSGLTAGALVEAEIEGTTVRKLAIAQQVAENVSRGLAAGAKFSTDVIFVLPGSNVEVAFSFASARALNAEDYAAVVRSFGEILKAQYD